MPTMKQDVANFMNIKKVASRFIEVRSIMNVRFLFEIYMFMVSASFLVTCMI